MCVSRNLFSSPIREMKKSLLNLEYALALDNGHSIPRVAINDNVAQETGQDCQNYFFGF